MPSPDSTTPGVILPNGNGGQSFHEDDHSVLMVTDSGTEHANHQDDDEDDKKNCRHRPRKRKLYTEICKQMEFYFSDANITKNRMMREIVEQANEKAEGYVDLSVFLDFTKIQRLTASIHHIRKALRNSQKLELSPDELKARRKVAFDATKVKSEEAVEECTIYVENIPRDADHEWLEKIFQAFGPVAYISLPKFKSGQHKGFGFVEFDDVNAARRCLEAYGEEGACLPSDIDPSELRSIQSFNEEQEETAKGAKNGKSIKKQKKRKAGESLPQDENEPKVKKEKQEEISSSSEDDQESKEVEADTNGVVEVGTSTSKKSKRKRKKNKAKKSGEAKLESESIMLKVLPKKSWRQLRNRYLNLQRSNMAKLKKQLQKEYVRAQHFKNFYQPPQNPDFNCAPQHHHHGAKYEPNEDDRETKTLDHIMEIKLTEPAESAEIFRHKISVELAEQDEDEAMISGFIKFVDYKDNEVQAYVRVNADESFSARAESLLKKAKAAFASARFLSAAEVAEYKRNVQALLKQKQKEQPVKKNNIRGKDRLMKAATKSNHVRFNDSSDEESEKAMNGDKVKVEVKTETSD